MCNIWLFGVGGKNGTVCRLLTTQYCGAAGSVPVAPAGPAAEKLLGNLYLVNTEAAVVRRKIAIEGQTAPASTLAG